MQPSLYTYFFIVYGRETQSALLPPIHSQYTRETLSIQKHVPTAPIKAPLSPDEIRNIKCVGSASVSPQPTTCIGTVSYTHLTLPTKRIV